jgi:hypothetical protein
LRSFNVIFTLNYDLLLYWVILKTERHSDGFGLGGEDGGFRTFRLGAYCTTYYMHGALHLFLGPQLETRKRVVTNFTITDDITSTIRREKQLPLFVAEGSSLQKLARINSVPYLWHCYEELKKITENVFIFGHSASENDKHVYDALFECKIKRIFFCVHRPEKYLQHMQEKLGNRGKSPGNQGEARARTRSGSGGTSGASGTPSRAPR